MANYQNHVVDPTYFYDAIAQFRFTYDWYVETERTVDEYGRLSYGFVKMEIDGSLQSQGVSLRQNKSGNTNEMKYKFYCKSLYRIKIGDFILYKNRWLHVDSVTDYDEYGVREADLTMVQLTNYNDLYEYVKYLEGEILV